MKNNDDLLTLRKEGNIEYLFSLKSDHVSFYTNANENTLNKSAKEFEKVMEIFKEVMYSYMGENPEIKNIVYTKGYNATTDELVEYLEYLNYRFFKDGISSSIKYGGSGKMNLLLRKYFINEKYIKNYLNNIKEYTSLLL